MKDWDETVSTPLKAKGGKKPSLVNPSDKHATSEGTNGFITFIAEGDPAPEIEWFKVTKLFAATIRISQRKIRKKSFYSR